MIDMIPYTNHLGEPDVLSQAEHDAVEISGRSAWRTYAATPDSTPTPWNAAALLAAMQARTGATTGKPIQWHPAQRINNQPVEAVEAIIRTGQPFTKAEQMMISGASRGPRLREVAALICREYPEVLEQWFAMHNLEGSQPKWTWDEDDTLRTGWWNIDKRFDLATQLGRSIQACAKRYYKIR